MSVNREAVFNSYKTIQEMFEARNKPAIAEELKRISNSELEELVRTKNVFCIDTQNTLRVVYYLEPKLKVQDVKSLLLPEVENFDHILLVIREKTTSSNVNNILDISKNIQVFELRELQFNISNHVLVPKHRLIEANDETINSIFQKLNIKSRSQLPVILKTDPMAKFLNAKTGDLVEITRYSPTSGEHIFYRICV